MAVSVVILPVGFAHGLSTHEFLAGPSLKITEGVPVGCGASVPEPPCKPGPLGGVNAMTVDTHHLWIAEEGTSGGSRVDPFSTATGAFLPPQLDEEEHGAIFLEKGIGVAHPEGEEEVYVGAIHEGKEALTVFGVSASSGNFQHAWTGTHTPNKSFTESEGERAGKLEGVAVDNSGSLETSGDVYVATAGFSRFASFNVLDVFKPIAGGEEPAGLVGQLTGTEEPGGAFVPFAGPTGVSVSGFNSDVLVADGEACPGPRCGVDVFEPMSGGLYKFLFRIAGAPQGSFQRIGPIAVDNQNGNIYIIEKELNVIDEFNSQGAYVGRLTGTPSGPFPGFLQSVAIDPESTNHLFVGETRAGHGVVDVFGGDVVIPDVKTDAASSVMPESAQLNGTINPDGAGEAHCQFVWGTSTTLTHSTTCPSVPNGEGSVPVSAMLAGLAPDTRYFYRLEATNANGTNTGEESLSECAGEPSIDACFTTSGPGIHDVWTSNISSTSVMLNAKVDPNGSPTKVFFEYGPTTEYGSTAPTPAAMIGSTSEAHVSERVQSLSPNTLYHYRAVAVNALGSFPGPDHTFTTQSTSTGLVLPDGRHWELVTPPDKHGAAIHPISDTGIVQAADSGDAISYVTGNPVQENAGGYTLFDQVFSSRGTVGWSSHDISTPHLKATGPSVGFGEEYRFFSEDLSLSLVEPQGEFTSLTPEVSPPDTERTPYIRHDTTCTITPSTCFEPLLTSAPGYADVPPGTKFGGPPLTESGQFVGEASFVGAAPDLSHAILGTKVPLTVTEPEASGTMLYEWSTGKPTSEQLQLVSMLPNGDPATGTTMLGFHDENARHAIATDGSRIVWSAESGPESGHLYVRDMVKKQTVQLDVPEAGCNGGAGECGSGVEAPIFQLASNDASRIFFTDTQGLTKTSATSGRRDLYECEIQEAKGKLSCAPSDLTPRVREDADVLGLLLGSSEDGSYVYFIANGVLGDGAERAATPGDCKPTGNASEEPSERHCNLYMWHAGTTKFIATLSEEDFPDWAGGFTSLSIGGQTARVSPNGRYLAFMSDQPLTGYDNHDASSGKPDEEVYLYDSQQSLLVCASCNPNGTRPTGVEYSVIDDKLAGGDRVWPSTAWIAANIPAWTAFKLEHARYQSRYLSDSGRLFFNSSDALVPQDSNSGNEDVYELEPAGVGNCASTSSAYIPVKGGCVALISSGRANGESAFLDASENGDDVFFLTAERLVPEDVDTAFDVYDAHVCNTQAPCLAPVTSPPDCTTADACRAAPTPQPSVFGLPTSAVFSGPSNSRPSKPAVLTPAQKLARDLKACRHRYHRNRHQRVRCERQARRRGAHETHKPRE